MKILITGANGQLGREAVLYFQNAGFDVIAISRRDIDLSKPISVASKIEAYAADWVIHCAAYTQVDSAEEEPELVFTINRDSTRKIAEAVRLYGGRLLYVSTDFVFDGGQSKPYREDDQIGPQGVYGQSKWEGEQAVRDILPEAIVLRTAWVYGVHGQNFVRTILRLATERDVLRVVDDQVGTPSWTGDIVRAMGALIESNQSGTFNYTNEGVASWYDFASQAIQTARELGYPIKHCELWPIPSNEYPTLATRPSFTVLNKEKVRPFLKENNPHWRASLFDMLEQLKKIDEQ